MTKWHWVKARTMQHLYDERGGLAISAPTLDSKQYFSEGNARRKAAVDLIAAAPDLLAALKAVVNDVEPTEYALASRVRDQINSAIQKAEGK